MNEYRITTKNGIIYKSTENDFSVNEPWMGLPERIVNADEPHDIADVVEEIPAVIEYSELVVEETIGGDEVIESIPAVMEGDEQIEPPKYRVNRPIEVEPPKVKLRAEYTIEVVDISAEIQEQAIMNAVISARSFGEQLINKMSARNAVKPGWDVAKTLAYIAQTESAMKLLQAGALETALTHIQSVTPSAELTQADIDFAVSQIQSHLGL